MNTKQIAIKSNQVDLKILSRSENVALARLLAAAFIAERDMTVADLDEIKVVVSEAVSNAIIHGYQGANDCYIDIKLSCDEHKFTIIVQDQGIGIADIKQAMQPNFSTGEERMGLGFAFMQSFMDDIEVISAPKAGTTVTMIKNLV